MRARACEHVCVLVRGQGALLEGVFLSWAMDGLGSPARSTLLSSWWESKAVLSWLLLYFRSTYLPQRLCP